MTLPSEQSRSHQNSHGKVGLFPNVRHVQGTAPEDIQHLLTCPQLLTLCLTKDLALYSARAQQSTARVDERGKEAGLLVAMGKELNGIPMWQTNGRAEQSAGDKGASLTT